MSSGYITVSKSHSEYGDYINKIIDKYDMKCQEWQKSYYGYDENGKLVTLVYGSKGQYYINSVGNRVYRIPYYYAELHTQTKSYTIVDKNNPNP